MADYFLFIKFFQRKSFLLIFSGLKSELVPKKEGRITYEGLDTIPTDGKTPPDLVGRKSFLIVSKVLRVDFKYFLKLVGHRRHVDESTLTYKAGCLNGAKETDLVDNDGTLKPGGACESASFNGAHDSSSDSDAYEPLVRPRRRRKSKETCQNKNDTNSNRPVSGLPPTPKVHMGACFLKVFNGCPLKLNCAASWVHSETKEQHILFGADEGIYTLNLNKLHESTMDRVGFF